VTGPRQMIPQRRLAVVNERHRHCLRPSSARPTGGFLCQRSCLSILSAGARGRDISITSLRHSDRGRGNLETAAPANGQFTLAPEGRVPGGMRGTLCMHAHAARGGGRGGRCETRELGMPALRRKSEMRDTRRRSFADRETRTPSPAE